MAWVLGIATIFGGVGGAIAFAKWLRGRLRPLALPTYSSEELRGRLRILVVDDQGFTYLPDFLRDGYVITPRHKLGTYSELESLDFDLVILDIRGIAISLSADDGLGVAKHVRSTCESRAILIYSAATYRIDLNTSSADYVFDLTAVDYQSVKDKVDEIFQALTTPEFYIRHFTTSPSVVDSADRETLRANVRSLLVSPTTLSVKPRLSSQQATVRAQAILRHVAATSSRLHRVPT